MLLVLKMKHSITDKEGKTNNYHNKNTVFSTFHQVSWVKLRIYSSCREYEISRSKRGKHLQKDKEDRDDPCVKEPNLCSKGKFKEGESFARYRKQHLSKWGEKLRDQKPGHGDQKKEIHGDQLKQGRGDQLKQGRGDQLKQGHWDQLKQGRGDQLKQGHGDQLKQGREDQFKGGHILKDRINSNIRNKDKIKDKYNEIKGPPAGRPQVNVPPEMIPRGVLPRMAQHYLPNQRGKYQCQTSQVPVIILFMCIQHVQ